MTDTFRRVRLDLPGRGGATSGYELGPADRPVDLVFSHANGFNALAYRSLLAPLADRWRVLALDLRGHGRAELPAEPDPERGWGPYGEDLAAILGRLDGAKPVLAGHSMGGAASLIASRLAPERVRALVLFDPVIMPGEGRPPRDMVEGSPLVQGALRRRAVFESREAALAAWRGRGAFRAWSDAALADYVEDGLRARPDGAFELACAPAWEAANFMGSGPLPARALAEAAHPVRILRAAEGSTARIDPAELPPGSPVTVETVAGTSHFLPFERPDLLVDVLGEALSV